MYRIRSLFRGTRCPAQLLIQGSEALKARFQILVLIGTDLMISRVQRVNSRLERADFGSIRIDIRPESERVDIRPVRFHFSPE